MKVKVGKVEMERDTKLIKSNNTHICYLKKIMRMIIMMIKIRRRKKSVN